MAPWPFRGLSARAFLLHYTCLAGSEFKTCFFALKRACLVPTRLKQCTPQLVSGCQARSEAQSERLKQLADAQT